MKVAITGLTNQYNGDSYVGDVMVNFFDETSGLSTERTQFSVPLSSSLTFSDFKANATASILAYAGSQSYALTANDFIWDGINPLISVGPISYQTIVSQTGTVAPAVSGGFTATSTYASGVTFTWARTGVGVYTLTASSAVFTAGKTGVFVAPLQNLNGSVRAVVTSSTVITVTTAVQSLAVLGLLNFTATNTDALLSGTMIYVQTYA